MWFYLVVFKRNLFLAPMMVCLKKHQKGVGNGLG